jgi:hypothetical protein
MNMIPDSLKVAAEERRRLYEPILKLTGRDDFIVSHWDVLRWMGRPTEHFHECKQYFETYSDLDGPGSRKIKPSLFDFHQFLTICNLHGEKCLEAFLGTLDEPLLIIGILHDDLSIAKKCAEAVRVAPLQDFVDVLATPRLSVNPVLGLVNIARRNPGLEQVLHTLLTLYRLHDPEKNTLSSYLTRVGKIKCARVLYLTVPYPTCWPGFETLLAAKTEPEIRSAWKQFCYEPPAYLKFSYPIQATVLRIAVFALSLARQHGALANWSEVLHDFSVGHDGKSAGFNNETLSMLKKLERNKVWITISCSGPAQRRPDN